jgi:hypothetical protein
MQVGRAAGAPLQLTPTHFMQWDSMLRQAGGGAAPRKGSTGPPPLRLTVLMQESLQLLHSTQPVVAYQRYGVPVEHQNPQQWLAAVKQLPVLQVTLMTNAKPWFVDRRCSLCLPCVSNVRRRIISAEALSTVLPLWCRTLRPFCAWLRRSTLRHAGESSYAYDRAVHGSLT